MTTTDESPQRDRLSLSGRTALVTGAGAGIGRAVALEIAARGGRVVALDLVADRAAEVAATIVDAGGEAIAQALDLRDVSSYPAVFQQIESAFGGVDILANIAGTTRWRGIEDTSVQDWDLISETNARAPFFLIQHAIPYLEESGAGAVVNVSSVAGKGYPHTSAVAYAASKAAVIGITRVTSAALAPKRIRVNCVCPGPTMTDFLVEGMDLYAGRKGTSTERELRAWVEQVPLKIAAEPSDIAGLICYLASDAARFVTGQSWNIDGGMVFD